MTRAPVARLAVDVVLMVGAIVALPLFAVAFRVRRVWLSAKGGRRS